MLPSDERDLQGGAMSGYVVAQIDEMEEVNDGRCPMRPVRALMGITSFGVNTWTGHSAGDRIINEHDEGEGGDSQEELYLVQQGRATFEVDGERVEAPSGPTSSGPPSPRSRRRPSWRSEAHPARRTSPRAGRSGLRSIRSMHPGITPRRPLEGAP